MTIRKNREDISILPSLLMVVMTGNNIRCCSVQAEDWIAEPRH